VYDQIKTQLDTIAELGDEQVAELQADIISQFEMVEGEDPTPETVDAMTSLADSLDMVRGELSRREAQAAELAARVAEATARVKGEDETVGEEMAMTEDEPMADDATPEEAPVEETESEDAPEAEVEAEEVTEEEEDDKEEEMAVAASGSEEIASDEVVTEAATETDEIAELSAEESVEEVSAPEAELSTEEVEAVSVEEAVIETSVETEASVEETVEVTEEAAELSADDEVVIEAVSEVAEDAVSEASTTQEDGSELSTTTVEATELSTDETAEAVAEVVEASELSSETNIESTTALLEEEEQKEQAVTAAAEQPFEAPADRQPVVQETEALTVAITAGADIPGYSAGSSIEMGDVATLMEKRLHSLRRVNGGDGEQHIVASFSTQYPEARFLGTDAEANSAKIASEGQALVASGGHAAPAEVKYDIFGIGSTTNRPVRDSLPAFQADRGGVRFVTAPSFASGDYANAVGVWTAANDSAETPSPSAKTSLTVTAAAENVAVTDAVTLQLQFGNLMTRAYPELIARHNELALVQHAREAEASLLTKIGAASTAVSSGTLLGFGRDFLVSVRKAAVAYRSRHRIAPTTTLQAIIPDWVFDAMASDLAVAMPGDNTLAVGRSEIEGYLAQSNVSLVASPDLSFYGAQGTAALLEFPDTFVWYLFAEGTFLFLDGGSLDLGIIRDSSLVGTNDYKMFVETFEGIAKVGIESLAITQTVNVNGVAAALRDTTGGATAAAIEL
jgi:chemotaxis protein histidine kinase CheA